MKEDKNFGKKPALSERDRQALFALLAIAAIGLAAYVLFLAEPADAPSDMDTFVGKVLASPNAALFFDVRGASAEEARIVYQCGVDLAGGSLFGSKTLSTYACDDNECMSVNSAQNGSNTLTYEQVRKNLRTLPYLMIKSGAPSSKFFASHAELTIDSSFNATCKLG